LSLLLVLALASRVFLRVLRFFSLLKNQHFQIPIRSGIRGPQGLSVERLLCATLVKQSQFIYFF